MKKLFLTILMVCTGLNMQAQQSGFENPVIPGFHPDPSVCCVGDDFYLVTSSFQYFPGVPLFHSKDLIHWEQIGNCLTRPSQLWLGLSNSSCGIYAPTIRYYEGTYYMVTTNVSLRYKQYITPGAKEEKANFIVYTDDINGEWSEPVFLDQGGIDPSLYFEDGHCYLVSNPNDQIMLCEINPKTGEQLSPSVAICDGTGGRYPEAPHIYKKDGYYYLMLAEGGTEEAHKLTMFRSKKIDGPYSPNPANPILTHCNVWAQNNPIHGTGHGDLVQAADGSWWLVGLAYRPQTSSGTHHLLGRETYLAPVRWDEGAWPVVNGNGTFQLKNTCATLPQVTYPAAPARQDLRNAKLGPQWIHLSNPVESNYANTSAGLELKATENHLDEPNKTITFAGLRQEMIEGTVSTQVSLEKAKKGDEAGLTTYMDYYGHYDLMVRVNAQNQREVAVRYTLGSLHQDLKVATLSGNGPVTLQVKTSRDNYAFAYSTDGQHFTDLGLLDTRFVSTETLGGFTGIVFGLYAQGDKGTSMKAIFPYIEIQ